MSGTGRQKEKMVAAGGSGHGCGHDDGIIFEFTPYGAVMRVVAMDPATLTEITIQGPVNADHRVLQALARRRLAYVLEKRRPAARRG